MLTELGGKAGRICDQARSGAIRCPLIVRQSSEDVITGHIFETLRAINPRWWLSEFLNQALGPNRFRQQIYRNLQINLWVKQPTFPKWLIPWDEGQTEVDVVITWENPQTTIFIEMKYGSPLSPNTTHNNGQGGFSSDQLIRNARIGLYQNGWYEEKKLFEMPPRDFALILMTPNFGNPLVEKYRNVDQLRNSIPNGDKLSMLPKAPFLGEISFAMLVNLLETRKRFMSKPEKILVSQLNEYLQFKLSTLSKSL